MHDARLIYVTTKDAAQAATIGRRLVEEGLCACVNILDGMHSIYTWQGQIEEAREAVLIVKTDAKRCDAAVAAVKRLHSYEVPCALVLPILGGNPDYLRWLSSRQS